MANEITITASLAFAKGNVASISRSVSTLSRTVSGDAYHANVQSVGTSEEAVLLGDIAAGGYCWLKNLDATNFVSWRAATALANTVKLLPGDVAVFRNAAAAPFVIADTATVLLEFLLIAP